MSEFSFELPETMLPVTDPRQLAADISYAHWLYQITQGKVSEADEVNYQRPQAADFDADTADKLAGAVYEWAFSHPRDGLTAKAEFGVTRLLFERIGQLTRTLTGLNHGIIRDTLRALETLHEDCLKEYEASRPQFADYGDMTYWREMELLSLGKYMLSNLVEPNEYLRDVLLREVLNKNWTRFLNKK